MLGLRNTIPTGVIFLILGIHTSAMAASMQCTVQMATASSLGLVPMDEEIVLPPTSVSDIGPCSTTTVNNMTLSLCAIKDTEAIGIYKVQVFISDDEGQTAVAREILATSNKYDEDLISLYSECDFTPQFIRKMNAAGLAYPNYTGGDSLMIDNTVASAFQKGILNKDDVVIFNVGNCELK